MSIKKTKVLSELLSKLDDVKTAFEALRDERQESFDNKSEKWQEGEKGEEESENISLLNDIVNELSSAYDNAENLFES